MNQDAHTKTNLELKAIIEQQSISNNIIIKAVILFAMLIVMQIPIYMISSLADDREATSKSADKEIIGSWGDRVTITTPRIIVSANQDATKNFRTLYDTNLKIDANLTSQELKRGIFSTTVFNALVEQNISHISSKSLEKLQKSEKESYDNIFLFVPTNHFKQKDLPTASINGEKLTIKSTDYEWIRSESGVLFEIPNAKIDNTKDNSIDISLNILGSQELMFDITNQATSIEVTSTWKSPNFNGDILPFSRRVDSDGFNATWTVENRGIPNIFGIELMVPVDYYRLIDRATKYSLLFIAMTFLAFFIVETVNRWRIHPMQYFLVGTAMVVFYALLLSFSEHIAFGWSYLIASIATTTLISLYTITILRQSLKSATIIPALLITLYLFLYFILQMQDYALVAGSILLFTTIGVAMFSLRNINWYNEVGK